MTTSETHISATSQRILMRFKAFESTTRRKREIATSGSLNKMADINRKSRKYVAFASESSVATYDNFRNAYFDHLKPDFDAPYSTGIHNGH
jgi:hypothetical protein